MQPRFPRYTPGVGLRYIMAYVGPKRFLDHMLRHTLPIGPGPDADALRALYNLSGPTSGR